VQDYIGNYQELKAYQRKHRDTWNQGLSLRVHRALSWLNRAEQERERDDTDAEFVFLWIAFNAAYANEYSNAQQGTERDTYREFFARLVDCDKENQLYRIIWDLYPSAIRTLMDNKYVFQPYWDSVNGRIESGAWKDTFEKARRRAHQALAEQDVATSLSIIMDRLYTLRNQLIHGGATWAGNLNREQLKDATAILRTLVPIMIKLMMENGKMIWGDAAYFEG